jgi:hypothetical protein
MGGGSGNCGGLIDVPEGKRLVVEHLSARLFVAAPSRPLSIGIRPPDALSTLVNVPVINQGLVGADSVGIASQQMHVYSDVDVEACVGLSAPSGATVAVEVNGYLTDRY